MRPLPLRLRLTAWYFAVLAATLTSFSVVAFMEMRNTMGRGVDDELRDRLRGFQEVLRKEAPFRSARAIASTLAEHTGGNDLFRMADDAGAWVYRSPAADSLEATLPRLGNVQEPASLATVDTHGSSLRILTTTLALTGAAYRVQVGENIDQYGTTTTRFGRLLLMSVPLMLMLAVTGGVWLSRRALLPVDRITREARDVTARNLGKRLEVPETRDELQRLSETLNSMLERLDHAFQRITQFTADASHELKTPLAVMRTMAEVPLRVPSSEAEYRQALTGIIRELSRTSKLVDDLLYVARGDSGASGLNKCRVNLIEVVRSAGAQGESMALRRQLSFELDTCDTSIWVDGDREALQRLLVILLDNATKYTPPQGSVVLRASRCGEVACVVVTDTGIGIDQADLPHVFERFYRADKARSRDSGGVGLGLAIARWIATGHGGTIVVTSTLGRGSLFSVRLPAIP